MSKHRPVAGYALRTMMGVGTALSTLLGFASPAVVHAQQRPPVVQPSTGQAPELLPLAVGNSWTYAKTVPQGKRAFFQRALPLQEGRSFVTIGQGVGIEGAVSCQETYTVVASGERGAWQVSITASPPECSAITHGPRDGRYNGASKIFWEKAPSANKEFIGTLSERIVYDRERLPPGWKDKVVEPIAEARDVGVLWRVLPPKGQSYFSVTLAPVGSNFELSASDKVVALKTPAGSFDTCFAVQENISIEKGSDKKDPRATGWTTYRHFCLGVGLVKEWQENRAGEVLYTMELTNYQLVSSR